jgi:hypothetical protein
LLCLKGRQPLLAIVGHRRPLAGQAGQVVGDVIGLP